MLSALGAAGATLAFSWSSRFARAAEMPIREELGVARSMLALGDDGRSILPLIRERIAVADPEVGIDGLELVVPRGEAQTLPVLGSAFTVDGEIQVSLRFSRAWLPDASGTSGVGLFLSSAAPGAPLGRSQLSIFHWHASGKLLLGHKHGDKTDLTTLGPSQDGPIDITVAISPGGASVTVQSPFGTQEVPLTEPLFATGQPVVGQFWVGPYATGQIQRLIISGSGDGVRQTGLPGGDTLRSLADQHGLSIGALAQPYRPVYDPRYEALLGREFGHVSANLIWSMMRPDRTSYSFFESDQDLSFAQAHGQALVAQHLVWGRDLWLPDWLLSGGLSRDQAIAVMRDHITTVLGRYRGKVPRWVVVNEAVSLAGPNPPAWHTDYWDRTIGQDYIELAFRAAREADPNVELIYNDFNNETLGPKSDAVYALATRLRDIGVLDGVGMQMHLDAKRPLDIDSITANMKRFGDLGLSVNVTELDVNIAGLPGSPEEKLQKQAGIYADVLQAALRSGACRHLTIFGTVDRFSGWVMRKDTQASYEAPLIFSDDYQPKPAYFAMRDALAR